MSVVIDRKLLALLGKDGRLIVYSVLLMVLGSLCNIGITACICRIFSILQNEMPAQAAYSGFFTAGALKTFVIPAVAALLCVLIRYGATRASGAVTSVLGRRVRKNLREKVYSKLLVLGVRSADGANMAGLTQMSMEGVEQMELYYSSYLPQFFFSLISPLILFIICVGINPKAAAVLLACVPLIPISIAAVSKYAKKIFAKYWDKYTSMGDVFLDSIQGLKDLKIFQADAFQHEKMNRSAEEFRKITMKVLVMQLASVTIMDIVAFGGAGLGIAFAVKGAAEGVSSPMTALFIVLTAVEFFLPLRSLGTAFHVAMNGASAGRRILALLDAKEPDWGTEKPESFGIAFENVSFSYDGERGVLNNVSVSFPEHGFTAIVGESGCGKTTMAKLITGAVRPSSGFVRIGGKRLETLSRDDYYANLSLVSVETFIFNDTLRANLAMADPEATEERMYEVLEEVRLDKFVRENGGLDMMISEDSGNISGGEKQRVALAVNLLKSRKIYVFDEATGNIDIESERIIMETVYRLSKKSCVIVISHRLANVTEADKILYMENGEIRESGTHSSLMSAAGGYAGLFKAQEALEHAYLPEVRNG